MIEFLNNFMILERKESDLSRIITETYGEITLKNFEEWYKVVSLFNTM